MGKANVSSEFVRKAANLKKNDKCWRLTVSDRIDKPGSKEAAGNGFKLDPADEGYAVRTNAVSSLSMIGGLNSFLNDGTMLAARHFPFARRFSTANAVPFTLRGQWYWEIGWKIVVNDSTKSHTHTHTNTITPWRPFSLSLSSAVCLAHSSHPAKDIAREEME